MAAVRHQHRLKKATVQPLATSVSAGYISSVSAKGTGEVVMIKRLLCFCLANCFVLRHHTTSQASGATRHLFGAKSSFRPCRLYGGRLLLVRENVVPRGCPQPWHGLVRLVDPVHEERLRPHLEVSNFIYASYHCIDVGLRSNQKALEERRNWHTGSLPLASE